MKKSQPIRPAPPEKDSLNLRTIPLPVRDHISSLEKEVSMLKEKLELMRKATAPMTRIVKDATQFTKLPTIRQAHPPPRDSRQDVHNCREPVLEDEISKLNEILVKHAAEAKQKYDTLQASKDALQASKDAMEANFINKIDDLRAQAAEKRFLADSYSHDINRLHNELSKLHEENKSLSNRPSKRVDNSELERLQKVIEMLRSEVQDVHRERDQIIEMGRKAELTTIEFMQRNNALERENEKLTAVNSDLLNKVRELERINTELIGKMRAATQQALMMAQTAVEMSSKKVSDTLADQQALHSLTHQIIEREFGGDANPVSTPSKSSSTPFKPSISRSSRDIAPEEMGRIASMRLGMR